MFKKIRRLLNNVITSQMVANRHEVDFMQSAFWGISRRFSKYMKPHGGSLVTETKILRVTYNNWLTWQILDDCFLTEFHPPQTTPYSSEDGELRIDPLITDEMNEEMRSFYAASALTAATLFKFGENEEFPDDLELGYVISCALAFAALPREYWLDALVVTRIYHENFLGEAPEFSPIEESSEGIKRTFKFPASDGSEFIEVVALLGKVQIRFYA